MGLLDWLVQFAVETAIRVAIVWLIKETVSYFLTKSGLRQLILQKKNEGQFESAVKAMIKNNNGHEVDFDLFDTCNTNLGSGKVASNEGVSNDIRSGDVIIL